jgi:myo-inositol-1(or 4)-monophosphatase
VVDKHPDGRSTAVPEPAELEALAVDLARRAGALMVQRRAAGFEIATKSSATDVVTDADRAVEDFLRSEITRLRPEDSVLGEEGGDRRSASSPVRWLIDPIDGTVNFMLGLPQYAVSIAAEAAGRTVAGCVFNPVSGDLFRASLGGGAYLGDRRLSGPRSIDLDQAIVATGFGYDARRRAAQGAIAGRLLGRVGNLRRLGSAALDLCAIAAGWVDLYYEGPLGEWDIAAGALIAAEAGAQLSGLRGRVAGPAFTAAAHPDRAEEFFALLADLGADQT